MTNPTAQTLTLHHHDVAQTLDLRDQILPVYAAAHHDLMGDLWFRPERFWERLVDLYAPGEGFGLVTGWVDDRLVGYAFGSPMHDGGQRWNAVRGHLPDLPPAGTVYIFREFAVHPDQQRRGYGRLIHDALLATRPEPVAHLLVRPDNTPARAAYTSWGWVKIGAVQPFPDSPTFDAMVLRLATPT